MESWTALGLLNEVSIDGEPAMSVAGLDRTSRVDLPLRAGALPRAADEVAIGAAMAKSRDLAVGDTVELEGAIARRATVSGIVVFPTLGPFLADRVGAGTGVLLPEAAFNDLAGPYEGADVRDLATFIGVDLRGGADDAARTRVREQLAGLDLLGNPVLLHPAPVRPPEIVDADSARGVPAVVAGGFAILLAAGLGFASWASVRSAREEHAVLRALGFRGAQLRRSVLVQTVATMVGALALGLPIGVSAGRLLWRGFADGLGVVTAHASAWPSVFVASAGGIAVAVLVAQVPALVASRARPADGSRTQ